MPRTRTWLLLTIIILFALALWVLLPIEGERFGRRGIQFGLDLEGGVRLVYRADLSQVDPGSEGEVIDGVIAVIANRINPLGVTEPNIEKRGKDQIVVELPKLSVTDVQKERIGRTALLEFRELVQVVGEEPAEGEEEVTIVPEKKPEDVVPISVSGFDFAEKSEFVEPGFEGEEYSAYSLFVPTAGSEFEGKVDSLEIRVHKFEDEMSAGETFAASAAAGTRQEEFEVNGVNAVLTYDEDDGEASVVWQEGELVIVSSAVPPLEAMTFDEQVLRQAVLEGAQEVVLKGEEEGGVEIKLEWVPATGVIDGEEKVLNSSYFRRNTEVRRGQLGAILLYFEFNEEGAQLFKQITGRVFDRSAPFNRLGIFEGDVPMLGDDGQPIAPEVRAVLSTEGVIEGLSLNEATELSGQLNAGRLPVPLESIGEINVDPTLGEDFVELSIRAGIIGIALVMFFMIAYYRMPGVLASLALVFYGTLVLALFKLIPVTLTLAGIGGFVLSIGMAVDANVLIFERMKEEFRSGQTLGAATETGFDRAWTAIRDSNITTFIVCLILYWVGGSIAFGGSVKGFALTLFIGVAVSMFTAIVVTRTLLRLFVGSGLAQRTALFTPYSGKK